MARGLRRDRLVGFDTMYSTFCIGHSLPSGWHVGLMTPSEAAGAESKAVFAPDSGRSAQIRQLETMRTKPRTRVIKIKRPLKLQLIEVQTSTRHLGIFGGVV